MLGVSKLAFYPQLYCVLVTWTQNFHLTCTEVKWNHEEVLCQIQTGYNGRGLFLLKLFSETIIMRVAAAAAAKPLQSCPTLCDPTDSSPSGSPVPGILQARILEWVSISFSNAWKWKVKVKLLSYVRLLATQMDCSLPGSSCPWDFPGKSTGVGCHCLLQTNVGTLLLTKAHNLSTFL